MCSKVIHLILGVLVLNIVLAGPAGAADPDLVGWWRFDEGSGTVATDFSGKGNDGTLTGDSHYVAGKIGMAMEFDGIDDFVEVPHDESLMAETEVTVMAWINTPRHLGPDGELWQGILSKSNDPRSYSFYTDSSGVLHFSVTSGGAYVGPVSTGQVPLNEWVHVCAMVIGGQQQFYIDGEDAGLSGSGIVLGAEDTANVVIGRTQEGATRSFLGRIDDPRIYMRGLTQEEVQRAMLGEGVPQAYGPDPADGAIHEDTWVTLSWQAGDFAASHNVYLGDNADDVDSGAGDTFRGNQGATFYVAGFPGFAYPEGLVPGTTYYWRIDEINDLNPESPWRGDLWSFTIPPRKAYEPDPADGTDSVATDARLSWTPGFGAKLHTVYFGDDLDTVANATVGIPSGTASYNPGPLEQEKVYYWRIDEFDGLATHKGDVWAFATQGAVGDPQPANGATHVSMAAILSWTAATSAASHEVYLGLDKEAVRSADTTSPEYKGSKALGAESYDPGLLELDTTYYWRVDAVYNGNPVRGPVWTFTVGNYMLIDDFENYTDNDVDGEAIWQSWADGFGIADNGAQVGYLLPPYAEQTIVHGGAQSMPLVYTNEAGVTNSEALLTLASPRDWSLGGVEELSIWARGDSANAAEPLYVAVSNSAGAPAVAANEDPAAATVNVWTQWRVPLQAFTDQGINLGNVDKIGIGLGSKSGLAAPGGLGTMYFDDIRLYRP